MKTKNFLEKGNAYTRMFIDKINSGSITKVDASDMLGITRPTLDTRIKTDMWKKTELTCIKVIELG